MADVLIIKSGQLPQFHKSANTGEFVVDPNAKKNELQPKEGVSVNPDLSAVEGVEPKYWKIENGDVLEMTSDEKVIVDDQERKRDTQQKEDLEHLTIKMLAVALIKKGLIEKSDLI